MKRILVPVDFSKSTKAIIKTAKEIAEISKAKIFLLHVASLDLGFVIGDVGFQYMSELEAAGMESETQKLKEYEKALEEAGVEVEILIKQGTPGDVIMEEIDENAIDLIVMGSQGKGVLTEAFIGSVSKNIIQKATIPVLVVPVPMSIKIHKAEKALKNKNTPKP